MASPLVGVEMRNMADKITSAASYVTSGGLVTGGMAEWFRSIDWNQAAVISGIVLGIATFLVNTYFSNRRAKTYDAAMKAYQEAIERGVTQSPPERDK